MDPFDSTQEVLAAPGVARRWHEEAVEWVGWKQRTRGQYAGRNGQEAIRFLTRFGERMEGAANPASPRTFSEVDLYSCVSSMGRRPKTKRFYLGLLGSFLRSRGNDVVQRSGVLGTISRETFHRRWLTAEDLDRLLDGAVGLERLVVALEGFQGLRRVEVLRLRVSDIDTTAEPWWAWIRGKAHKGEPSRHVPISDQVRHELNWYLQLREQWAHASTNVPELLVWDDGRRLRPYSAGSVDRFVRRAGRRAGLVVSNHDLRRSFGRLLKNRGADWREIAGLYGHSSIAQSEYYVGQEQDRMVSAIRLTTLPGIGGKP